MLTTPKVKITDHDILFLWCGICTLYDIQSSNTNLKEVTVEQTRLQEGGLLHEFEEANVIVTTNGVINVER